MSEELTAEERACVVRLGVALLTHPDTHPLHWQERVCLAKLLRLYDSEMVSHQATRDISNIYIADRDAALARAKAAEKSHRATLDIVHIYESDKNAAESRLAEATALLLECRKWYRFPERITSKISAFLSAAPAQAAEPVTPEQIHESLQRGIRDARIVAGDPVIPAQAAEPDSFTKLVADATIATMHPDQLRIALRECRADHAKTLEGLRIASEAFESARSERDTALARIAELEDERDGFAKTAETYCDEVYALRARIAELEAAVAEMQKDDFARLAHEYRALKARIARAVAELRKLTVMNSQDAGQVVDASRVEDIASDLEAMQ